MFGMCCWLVGYSLYGVPVSVSYLFVQKDKMETVKQRRKLSDIWYQKFLNNLPFALLYSNKQGNCFDVKEDNTQITWMLMTDSLKWYACGLSAQIGDIPFKGNRLYTWCLVANAIINYRCWTVNIKNILISIKRKTHKKTNYDNGVMASRCKWHFLNLLIIIAPEKKWDLKKKEIKIIFSQESMQKKWCKKGRHFYYVPLPLYLVRKRNDDGGHFEYGEINAPSLYTLLYTLQSVYTVHWNVEQETVESADSFVVLFFCY